MALVPCTRCGHTVNTVQPACPQCGELVKQCLFADDERPEPLSPAPKTTAVDSNSPAAEPALPTEAPSRFKLRLTRLAGSVMFTVLGGFLLSLLAYAMGSSHDFGGPLGWLLGGLFFPFLLGGKLFVFEKPLVPYEANTLGDSFWEGFRCALIGPVVLGIFLAFASSGSERGPGTSSFSGPASSYPSPLVTSPRTTSPPSQPAKPTSQKPQGQSLALWGQNPKQATEQYWKLAVLQRENSLLTAQDAVLERRLKASEYYDQLLTAYSTEGRRVLNMPIQGVDRELTQMVKRHLELDARTAAFYQRLFQVLPPDKRERVIDLSEVTELGRENFLEWLARQPAEVQADIESLLAELESGRRGEELLEMRAKLQERYQIELELPTYLDDGEDSD